MASRVWKMGLHIQQDGVRAVALQRRREGWQLNKWWYFPLIDATDHNGLIGDSELLMTALQALRAELPSQHHLRIAFPARRTVQRTVPLPDRLCESECQAYVTASTARSLQMPPDSLLSDYSPDSANTSLFVTAAHHHEVSDMTTVMARAGFSQYALTPDACALTSFFSFAGPHVQGMAAHDGEQWLWATRERWGCLAQGGINALSETLSLAPSQWLCCSERPEPGYNACHPWQWLTWQHPPKAPDEWRFAVALGLALGSYAL